MGHSLEVRKEHRSVHNTSGGYLPHTDTAI